MIDAPLAPRAEREKLTTLAFESFNLPRFYVVTDALASLCATGPLTTGIVCQSGYGLTSVVPIYEGSIRQMQQDIIRFGGIDVTEYLWKEYLSPYWHQSAVAEKFKCKYGYISLDMTTESEKIEKARRDKQSFDQLLLKEDSLLHGLPSELFKTVSHYVYSSPVNPLVRYSLPNGDKLWLDKERAAVTLPIFEPHPTNSSMPMTNKRHMCGLDEVIVNRINTLFEDKNEYYKNIVIAGGNTMFPGFVERIEAGVKQRAPSQQQDLVRVNARQDRKFADWIGGAALATLSTTRWISKEDFEEAGPGIVLRNWT